MCLHKIVDGGTDKSYGVYVARLAGVPRGVIERAKEILAHLESARLDSSGVPKMDDCRGPSPAEVQLGLFAPADSALLKKLRALDIESMTPIEAMNKLKELKDEAQQD